MLPCAVSKRALGRTESGPTNPVCMASRTYRMAYISLSLTYTLGIASQTKTLGKRKLKWMPPGH